jgi:hypothetical protein
MGTYRHREAAVLGKGGQKRSQRFNDVNNENGPPLRFVLVSTALTDAVSGYANTDVSACASKTTYAA